MIRRRQGNDLCFSDVVSPVNHPLDPHPYPCTGPLTIIPEIVALGLPIVDPVEPHTSPPDTLLSLPLAIQLVALASPARSPSNVGYSILMYGKFLFSATEKLLPTFESR